MEWSRKDFLLMARRLPRRLEAEEAGVILGFLPHEMTILLRAGLLKTALLGTPAQNGHKYFSTGEIQRLGEDDAWLNKATKAVQKCWQDKNSKQETLI